MRKQNELDSALPASYMDIIRQPSVDDGLVGVLHTGLWNSDSSV